jgi:hypothetical protein
MIEISDLSQIVPRSLLESFNEGALHEVLSGIADAARAEWIRLAGKEFFTTRRDYIAGIQPVSLRPGIATIRLLGELPNLLEHGMPEIQMHDTLLGSKVPLVPLGRKGKHPSKDGGVYRAIPFRHAGAGAGGAVGQPMGRPYQSSQLVADAKQLGKKVYKMAQQLEPTIGKPGGPTVYGGRLEAGAAGTPKLREYHATDIHAGMIKAEKTYEKATQAQYVTFRTIALDSGGQKKGTSPWVRPATEGRELSKQVAAFVKEIAPKAFQAYVEGLK